MMIKTNKVKTTNNTLAVNLPKNIQKIHPIKNLYIMNLKSQKKIHPIKNPLSTMTRLGFLKYRKKY